MAPGFPTDSFVMYDEYGEDERFLSSTTTVFIM